MIKMVNVKIYSTPTCPYCKLAKEFFKEKNISFTNIDVASSEANAEEMKKVSGQTSVPVIVIDEKVIVGFDKNEIEKLIK